MPNSREREVGIRLSVKDAEVAKRALAAFGKEGEQALKNIENSARKATPGLLTLSNGIRKSREYAQDFAREVTRSFLGPLAAIGAAAGAIEVLRDALERVKQIAELGDLAERIGLGVDKLQGLQATFLEMGNDIGDLNSGLQTFAANLGNVDGPLAKVFSANNVKISGDTFEDLKRYADLVKNARNEQDKLRLVQLAVGKGNKELADLIGQGGEALAFAADEAHRLGTSLNEVDIEHAREVTKELAELNLKLDHTKDEFALLIAPAEIAGLETLNSYLKDTRDILTDIGSGNALGAITKLSALMGISGGTALQRGAALLNHITVHGGTVENGPVAPSTFDFQTFLNGQHGGGHTILPSAGDHAAEQQAKKIDDVRKALELELKNLGLTNREQEINNQLARANVSITSDQGKEIAALTGELYDEKQHLAAVDDATQALAQIGESVFEDLIDGTKSWNDILGDTVKSLEKMVLQAALMGSGPLAGLLGTSATTAGGTGGLFGALAGALMGGTSLGGSPIQLGYQVGVAGARAGGGGVEAGKLYRVNENGVELFMPSENGNIVPHGEGAGRVAVNVTVINNSNAKVRTETGANGKDLRVIIDEVTAQNMTTPGTKTDRALRTVHGTTRRPTGRGS